MAGLVAVDLFVTNLGVDAYFSVVSPHIELLGLPVPFIDLGVGFGVRTRAGASVQIPMEFSPDPENAEAIDIWLETHLPGRVSIHLGPLFVGLVRAQREQDNQVFQPAAPKLGREGGAAQTCSVPCGQGYLGTNRTTLLLQRMRTVLGSQPEWR